MKRKKGDCGRPFCGIFFLEMFLGFFHCFFVLDDVCFFWPEIGLVCSPGFFQQIHRDGLGIFRGKLPSTLGENIFFSMPLLLRGFLFKSESVGRFLGFGLFCVFTVMVLGKKNA